MKGSPHTRSKLASFSRYRVNRQRGSFCSQRFKKTGYQHQQPQAQVRGGSNCRRAHGGNRSRSGACKYRCGGSESPAHCSSYKIALEFEWVFYNIYHSNLTINQVSESLHSEHVRDSTGSSSCNVCSEMGELRSSSIDSCKTEDWHCAGLDSGASSGDVNSCYNQWLLYGLNNTYSNIA